MGAGVMKVGKTNKKCLNCDHEFTFKEKYRGSWRRYGRVVCPSCGSRYKHDLLQVAIFLAAVLIVGNIGLEYLSDIQIPVLQRSLTIIVTVPAILSLVYTKFMTLHLDPLEDEPALNQDRKDK
jgi:CXXC-20-CXXC protein